jgi:hypothetical protein
MLKSKIHRATVTGRDVDYVGSVTIDPEPMASGPGDLPGVPAQGANGGLPA